MKKKILLIISLLIILFNIQSFASTSYHDEENNYFYMSTNRPIHCGYFDGVEWNIKVPAGKYEINKIYVANDYSFIRDDIVVNMNYVELWRDYTVYDRADFMDGNYYNINETVEVSKTDGEYINFYFGSPYGSDVTKLGQTIKIYYDNFIPENQNAPIGSFLYQI